MCLEPTANAARFGRCGRLLLVPGRLGRGSLAAIRLLLAAAPGRAAGKRLLVLLPLVGVVVLVRRLLALVLSLASATLSIQGGAGLGLLGGHTGRTAGFCGTTALLGRALAATGKDLISGILFTSFAFVFRSSFLLLLWIK